MGLRKASLGRPDAVVMAPALTETQSTSTNLKFASSSIVSLSLKSLRPPSPTPAKDEPVRPSDHQLDVGGMNGHSPRSPIQNNGKTTYNINGLVKNLVKNEFLSINTDGQLSASQQMMSGEDMGHLRFNKPHDDILQGSDDFKPTFGHDDIATPDNDLGQEEVEELLSTLKPGGFEFEKDFLDCINMSDDDIGLVSAPPVKETLLSDRLDNVKKCLHQFHRRKAHLLLRLRKMEALFLGKHVAEETTGVIEFSTGLVESAGRPDRSSPVKKTLPTMSLFMRQVDHAAEQQANAAARTSAKNFKYFGSGSSTSGSSSSPTNGLRQSPTASTSSNSILPDFPLETAKELDVVARELSAQQRKILQNLDSDATESSSGGESADEMAVYSNPHQHPLSINKRCLWRWAEDRASLASRWIWLQSQIADLDYKIRQANDLRKHIKSTKTPLRLEDPPVDCGDETCARVRPLKRTSFAKRRLVGLRSVLRSSKRAASRPATVRCSCRGRIVLPGGAGVTDHSCILCTGRMGADLMGPRDPLEHLASVHDRVGLLDPSFHPQPSFSSDVSQSLHYNAIMRTPEWQARAARVQQRQSTECSQDQTSRGRKPTSMGLAGGGSVALPPHPSTPSATTSSSLLQDYHIDAERSRAAVVAVSSKIRRKSGPRGGRRGKRNHLGGANDRPTSKRSRKHQHLTVDGRETSESVELAEDGSDSFQMPPSPAPSPASATSKDKEVISNNRRKRENSYDIDNIVIPYSMAASTRTEMLKYKEILTPKWRRVTFDPNAVNAAEHKNGVVRRPSHEVDGSGIDETSDESFIVRHERCEIEERKKFLSYMKKNAGAGSGAQAGAGGRGRGRARTDSRAESSGPNTPDPMSPDPAAAGDSLTSPPATPAPLDDPCAATASSLTSGTVTSGTSSLASGARRRTVSSSKTTLSATEFSQSSYYVEYIPEGLNFEPRKFPLSDEEYSKMLADSSEGSSNYTYQDTFSKLHNPFEIEECFGSPGSVSTDSADSITADDPNDPEWTSAEPRR